MIFLAETRIEIRRRNGFTVLPNDVLQDPALNLQTKGLFCLMLSLSEGWDYSVRGLASFAGCGRDKIRNALENLEKAGYLLREQVNEGGKFGKNVYILQDWKSTPLPGFTATGFTATENPSAENPTQRKEYNKQIPPIAPQGGRGGRRTSPRAAPDWKPERFEGLWDYYPHDARGNRQRAIAAWDKLRPSDELIAEIGRCLRRLMASERWQAGVGIPHVSTFLNPANERWKDAYNVGDHRQGSDREEVRYGWQ